MKFGGTSIATTALMHSVAKIVKEYCEKKIYTVIVLSAMGDTTDALIAQAHKICPQPDPRSLDQLLSCGEQTSVSLMAITLMNENISAICLNATQAGIFVNSSSNFGDARICSIDVRKINAHFRSGRQVVIITGYQGVPKNDQTKLQLDSNTIYTLGRGGSDTTAVALAAALKCRVCDIYTDVDGIYTTDPNRVREARLLSVIDYAEMIELAHLGAGVLHSRCIAIAAKYGITLHLRSSKHRRPGTYITNAAYRKSLLSKKSLYVRDLFSDRKKKSERVIKYLANETSKVKIISLRKNARTQLLSMNRQEKRQQDTQKDIMKKNIVATTAIEEPVITGFTLKTDEARLTVHNIADRPGLAGDLFTTFEDANVNVNLIAQATGSGQKNSISLTVLKSSLEISKRIVEDFISLHPDSYLEVEPNIGIVSAIGIGMKSHSGIAAKMFRALAKENINIEMITTSEIKISAVIDYENAETALQTVHREFIENR